MLRFSAHLSFLYLELPFARRMEAAKRSGFAGVECAVPEIPATEMRDRADELGLTIVGINTAPGEAESDRLGYAALPGREKDFARNLDAALDYAATAGAGHVHVLAGLIDGVARVHAEATFMRNMESAIPRAERAGVRLVVEGLNSRDRPGYFLSRSEEAFAIVERFGSPWLKAMFDTYHAQIMEGDILARIAANLSRIGHIQISGVPGRSEPDHGELNHREVLGGIDRLGWTGFIGCEYKPRTTTLEGIGWMKTLVS
ncbi:MAG: TIM barrel protein [Hyphomicrobiales bacterium]|nr:TIM barrel protein [Hyphomicrobiales bacterium]